MWLYLFLPVFAFSTFIPITFLLFCFILFILHSALHSFFFILLLLTCTTLLCSPL
ncbi:unnamed protein product [Meloidogyne enterolobii]|uniref:Uncharacterized protein n=1 Tax=Meloidogyne enterolobii TaxID=390850 RepID=A0ACB1ATX3_MELEN